MQKIAILGAGGLGGEVKLLIDQINQHSLKWEFVGFYDDNDGLKSSKKDHRIISPIEKVNELKEKTALVVAVGDPRIKSEIVSRISENNSLWFPSLIHPQVYLDPTIEIGEGSIITIGNMLTVGIRIGDHVLINLGCTIGHDVEIDDHSSIMPSTSISGNVKIGSKVLIGTGVKIINNCSIGNNSVIGAGSVVIRDVPENSVHAGVPSKPLIRKTK
jgi:sugar O-acyltransferase (sialic acid O-acetyltransferase NeuD family)